MSTPPSNTLPPLDLPPLIAWAQLAAEASKAICETGPTGVIQKGDGSPVTAADKAAHEVIQAFLVQHTPEIPVISEEGDLPANGEWQQWPRYWCVDPLDGTQSFIDGHDDYSINIGLIEHGQPVFGVLAMPERGELYLGGTATNGVWAGRCDEGYESDFTPLSYPTETPENSPPVVAVSRWAPGKNLDLLLKQLATACNQQDDVAVKAAGGASKFALLATQTVNIYPRFGRSMIWDTAAGHALVTPFGAKLGVVDSNYQLVEGFLDYGGQYHQTTMENPRFIAANLEWLHLIRTSY